MAHDRVGFPDDPLAIDQRRHLAVRIDGEIGRRLLLALDQVEIDELDRRLQVSGYGAGLPRREDVRIVKLHGLAFLSCARPDIRRSARWCWSSRADGHCAP